MNPRTLMFDPLPHASYNFAPNVLPQTKTSHDINRDHTSFIRLNQEKQKTLCQDRRNDCPPGAAATCMNRFRMCYPKNVGNKNKAIDTTVLNDALTRTRAGGAVAPPKAAFSVHNPMVRYVAPGPLVRTSGCCWDPAQIPDKKKHIYKNRIVPTGRQTSTFPDGKQYNTLAQIHPKEAMKTK